MSSGGGGEGEGEGACESNVADSVARAPKRGRGDPSLVKARDYDSRTPLHVKSLHGWVEVSKCLIEFDADVNAQDRWKNTVLSLSLSLYIYIYIYICVCVCVCVWFVIGWLMGEVFAFSDEYLKFSVVLFRKASG